MENNDKLIRDLLNEGFLAKAPEGFTNKVMQSVAETQKKPALPAFLVYFLVFFGASGVAAASLYFTNNSLLILYYGQLKLAMSQTFVSFFRIVNDVLVNINLPDMGLSAGILLMVILLLVVDRIAFKPGKYMNLFLF